MDRRFAVTLLAILAVAAGAAVFASRERHNVAPLNESIAGIMQPSSSVEEAPSPASATKEYQYIIREYEGYVAVFNAQDEQQPEMVLDTLVQYLPDYDQLQLAQGIPVEDYSQLVALIEDFIS